MNSDEVANLVSNAIARVLESERELLDRNV